MPVVPDTLQASLDQLAECSRLARERFAQHPHEAQLHLERAFQLALESLGRLGLKPERLLASAIKPAEKHEISPHWEFRLFADRLEIWAEGEHRGGWALTDAQERERARQLAYDLGAHVIEDPDAQLRLF